MEIQKVNLSYLVFAQALIRQNRSLAKRMLGQSEGMLDILEVFTQTQIGLLANRQDLLCKMQLQEHAILSLLTESHLPEHPICSPKRATHS